jgi:hypothetical protein
VQRLFLYGCQLIKINIMKRIFQAITVLAVAATIITVLQGCRKPCKGTNSYTYFTPLYKEKAVVKANIKSNAPQPIHKPGKIYIRGNYIFLNEIDKGLHVIDNSNPAAPVNRYFIDLPGNVDIAVKGNLLYADFYADLVVMDISNPLDVQVKTFVDKVFPERYYYGYGVDSTKIICGWEKKTETYEYDCDDDSVRNYIPLVRGVPFNSSDAGMIGLTSASANVSPTGISGSMARFALINNYLYTVSTGGLNTISLAMPLQPQKVNALNISWGIETIYPFKDKLFIGSRNGMYICNLQNPAAPVISGTFTHANACDPVIADDNTAYVTLHSGTLCNNFTNQLDVLDITNIAAPQLIKTYQLTNPKGLGKDGKLLFVCDGTTGVRVYNAANPAALVQFKLLPVEKADDVIVYNGIALIVSPYGLYQYDYSNAADIRLLSKIEIEQ